MMHDSFFLTSCDPKQPARLRLSLSAYKRLQEIKTLSPQAAFLRIYVDSGGCSGFQYLLSLVEAPQEDDVVLSYEDVKVLIDAVSLNLLNDTLVDYKEEMMGSAFILKNPNATSACGCGNSFSVF